ncbi:IAA-alanine resistance protein 1-like [Pyrus ussuriensis x Pyrus communis]|uniref:IAA-alanine resistance protein 1-like n=1 Tax=Pyrus ussuriensis x Pyrus communis TaxID=2448454 RepID=A0A5N5HKS7_9ROSA|nr:IAA-alanine resistance protein 1-like [Pyrus ussuriensis x Pyrus communis]
MIKFKKKYQELIAAEHQNAHDRADEIQICTTFVFLLGQFLEKFRCRQQSLLFVAMVVPTALTVVVVVHMTAAVVVSVRLMRGKCTERRNKAHIRTKPNNQNNSNEDKA